MDIQRILYYYINTNEIPSELSRENMTLSYVKVIFTQSKITVAMVTYKNHAFPGMAPGFFSLGPGIRMSGQIGVPSIFWGSENLGDSLREKKYLMKKRE